MPRRSERIHRRRNPHLYVRQEVGSDEIGRYICDALFATRPNFGFTVSRVRGMMEEAGITMIYPVNVQRCVELFKDTWMIRRNTFHLNHIIAGHRAALGR